VEDDIDSLFNNNARGVFSDVKCVRLSKLEKKNQSYYVSEK
jgi:hypothetical protein